MRKSVLKSGENMLVVQINHFVKKSDFAKHLTEYFYNRNEGFDPKLTKAKAKDILNKGLFFNGLYGSIESGFFEASYEEGTRYNEIYNNALAWVELKYKYDW